MGYLGGPLPGGPHPGGPLPGGPLPSADAHNENTKKFRRVFSFCPLGAADLPAADLPEECVACVRWGQRTSRSGPPGSDPRELLNKT